jgi:hypothetical protein
VKHLEIVAADVRRVERIQHLEVVECLPQGVRARFVEGFRVVRSSGRIRPSKLLKDSVGKLCLEICRRRRKFSCRWMSSTEEHLVILQISSGGTDGRYSLRRIHDIP